MKNETEDCLRLAAKMCMEDKNSQGENFYMSFFHFFIGAMSLHNPELSNELRSVAEKYRK